MFNFFIDRPVFSTVVSLIITLAGALAAFGLPISQYPQIVPPQVQVSTSFPGANANVVTQSIAAPIEQQVNGAKGMIYMDSKSANDGSYSLTVTFDIGTNQDLDAVDVQNRVAIAQSTLPADVIRQGITIRKQSTDFLEVLALTSPDGRFDTTFMSNYALLNLQDTLSRIPGVGFVRIFGARDYSMRIWLDPDKMARLGVTAGDVRNVIQEQNVVAPAGRIGVPPVPAGQQMQYSATIAGRLSDPAQYENMIVRAGANGQIVYLKDIARIELGGADYSIGVQENGIAGVFIGIFLQPDANALDVARQVKITMDDAAKRFPQGMVYSIPYSTTPFVTESLKDVLITLGIAFVLVLIVVFLFLQTWRATIIPMLAIPVSLIGTFAAFSALGFSINTLTLFGLVLAIGIVVDDAIVVVEAVQHRLDTEHPSPKEATKAAIADVGGPVIAIALVLAAVFIPVAFLGGLTGQLYRQFALTLAISVILSAIVALTLTPALCALLLRPAAHERPHGLLGRFFDRFNRLFDASSNRYSATVVTLVRHAVLVMLTFIVIIAALYLLIKNRPTGLVPTEDQGYVFAVMQLPNGASLERTNAAVAQLTRIARETPGVDGVASLSGFNLLTGLTTSYNSTSFIRLKPWDERKGANESADAIVGTLLRRLNSEITEARALVLNPPPIRGLGTTGGFDFILQDRTGGDPKRFGQVLQEVVAAAHKRPEIGFVFPNYDDRTPQIEYEVDREKVKTYGIALTDVFFTLQALMGSYYINDFNLYGRTFRVQMQAEAGARASPDDVNRYYVRNTNGDMIPLSAVLRPKSISGPEFYERYNIYRAATITGATAPGYSSGQAAQAMQEVAAATLPAGFGYEWTGSTYQELKTGGQTAYIFALSLMFVFLVLAALYESWAMPVAILLVIPFGVLGAFVGLLLRNEVNNVYTQIGLIMLIGLAAKNAILIVEFAKLARERGTAIVESARQAAQLRLRPILMTSFAFILGTLPLAIATGAGAGARKSIGTTVVFGMLFATMLGIFVIPVFYVVLQRISERKMPFRREQESGAADGRPPATQPE
ncbi:efflux RND transporter permease subunit [Noviherbaspirillum sp. UKPF54]|uniref:efflux RND transporter permease subunit n=1 Tax=Noviherbaspirillum sp. UKPF54 TaxID=2601898 RepID=UPI0011B18BCC|nr:multidrug efflux RND transporter permease subunit [Noviherbaspirillum sp. UKPF54]QDZ28830.1 multidrug efflux RND transporter permease subunit [Noviherbaspirillum sp. UKPF54]